MKKNGFTLTEILAVVVILTLLMLIVAPNLLNSIKNRKPQVTEAQEHMIKEAANLYADSNFDKNSSSEAKCITIETLIKEGYLNDSVQDATSLKDEEKEKFKKQSILIINTAPRTIKINDGCTP